MNSALLNENVKKALLDNKISGKGLLELIEKEILRYLLFKHKYNHSKVSQDLGISRGTLYSKLNKHFKGAY